MRENEKNRRTLGGPTAVFAGLVIAALAFSAGVVSARSHRPASPRQSEAVAAAANSATAITAAETSSNAPLNQENQETRVPGHPELDLQLD